VLGDSAALASLELRGPSLSRWFAASAINEWRFYSFTEGGHLAVHDSLAGEHASFDLASVGVGTKGKLWDYLNGSADFAVPLLSQTSSKRYDPRLTFRVWSEF
jgi:hemolysin activation/secretion protein